MSSWQIGKAPAKGLAAQPGKGAVAQPGAELGIEHEYGLDPGVSKAAGWWTEPDTAAESTATLSLDTPQVSVPRLLLRANVPSTIRLTGPKDLLFSAFHIKLTARSLDRNLAKPEWGSTRSITGADPPRQEILLAAPARIEAVGVRHTGSSSPVRVDYKDSYYRPYVFALSLHRFSAYKGKYILSGYHEQAVVTQAVQFDLLDEDAALLLRSPSLPSRVGLALGDDTPAQLFPTEMELDGTVTSRDLTGQINAAWRRGIQGETAEVQLRITSLTDGVVQVDLAGSWGRSFVSPEFPLAFDAANPVSVGIVWPFGSLPAAEASLRLTGQVEGGRRLGLVTGPPGYQVRTTERMEVAQAVRIDGGEAPVAKRQVAAIWLMLPRPPRTAERIELRLAEATGDPPFPADEPMARMEVTLPADAAAYVVQTGGCWYRAALEKPVELDGTMVTSPLFIIAAGREGGSLLTHRGLGVSAQSAGRVPAAAGAGVSLIRNLDRTGTWEVQAFNQQAAHWLMDLELLPTPAEYPGLMTLAYGAAQPSTLPLGITSRVKLDTAYQGVQRPVPYTAGETSPPMLSATLTSAVRASLTAQLSLYKAIR